MRGGPIDLTPFGALLTGIGWLYWLLAAAGLWWALRGERPWKKKLLRALPIVLLFGLLPGLSAWQRLQGKFQLDRAMVLFDERCKTAGEKIYRIVNNVEGIVWMKWREKYTNDDNFADQWKLNDPYGRDCGEDTCIKQLLRASEGLEIDPQKKMPFHEGYRFVESVDPREGKAYRYTLRLAQGNLDHQVLELEPIDKTTARYGVTWDDISTREDRERWIAGSSLKVIDLQTNEVLAERIGYMIDGGQGSQAGGRAPWLFAVEHSCPAFKRSAAGNPMQSSQSRDFVRKTLQLARGN